MKVVNFKRFGAVLRLALIVGLLTVWSAPIPASAHVLKSDNGVAAVLHIPPYDAPVANVTEPLQFQFGTTSGSFQINDYAVSVTVLNGDHVIKRQPVIPPYFGANAEGNAKVVFPEPAVYTLRLAGVSKSAASNFNMTYQLRVTGVAKVQKTNGAQILLIGAAGLIILTMVATRQIVTGKRYAAKSAPKSKISSKSGKKRTT